MLFFLQSHGGIYEKDLGCTCSCARHVVILKPFFSNDLSEKFPPRKIRAVRQRTTRGKENITLTSVGIEPTTSGLDLPLLCRLSYEVGQRKSGTI